MIEERPDCLQPVADEWVSFPGGELEGRRPKTLCPACADSAVSALPVESVQSVRSIRSVCRAAFRRPRRDRSRGSHAKTICFECYRADLQRQRALRAAAELDTASTARFEFQRPFEPVNRGRLVLLKAARRRGAGAPGVIAEARVARAPDLREYVDKRRRAQIAARHALQRPATGLELPVSWLPFAISR